MVLKPNTPHTMEKHTQRKEGTLAFAMYRPKAGKEQELQAIVDEHMPTLRQYGLVTDRPAIRARSADGTLIEIFEWASLEAVSAAHQHPAIAKIWERMGPIADFPSMKDLPEAGQPFPGFYVM